MPTTATRATNRLTWTRATLQDPVLMLTRASSDASFRSYWRTEQRGRSYLVMDSPPALEDPRPWLAIGKQLADIGVHVPAVYAADLAQGFLLIEDLGTQLYLQALNDANADTLYGAAMDTLLRMQTRMDYRSLPVFDRALLLHGLELMPEWFLGRHLNHILTPGEQRIVESAFAIVAANALEQPRCFVHRDYHSRNLLLVTGNSPGVIDFQGALAGPISYDLASLLRDAYIAWPRPRIEAWVEAYRERLREAALIDASNDRTKFLRWFDLTGLHRHIRVLGQFYRLWYRDGKPGYLADVPRIYSYVVTVATRYPELADFAALLERHAQGLDLTQVHYA